MSHVHDPQVYKSLLYHCSTTRDDRLGIYNRCNHLARFKAYTSTCMLSSHLNTFESISSLFLSLIVVDTRCIKSLANPLTAVVSCPCDGRI